MKPALIAVANLTDIDLKKAAEVTRNDPLFDEEIQIEEELINLEEAIDMYHAADDLKHYPTVRRHLLHERRAILQHCLGLIVRMIYGQRLPREYKPQDVDEATKKVVQLIVEDAVKAGYEIDDKKLAVFRPYLGWRQRLVTREGTMSSKSVFRKLAAI